MRTGGCRLGPTPVETSGICGTSRRSRRLTRQEGVRFTAEQVRRLDSIHERLIEARRELDALIGDAYLRPRASIVPVHFLDLASAVEKLRWAEKEWRELNESLAEAPAATVVDGEVPVSPSGEAAPHDLVGVTAEARRS